jgi:two-component sensor histidine kinase
VGAKAHLGDYVFRLRPWSLYAFLFASVCIMIAFGLRELFAIVGATLYFATFFPAILMVGLFAGIPAASASVFAISLIVWWAFFPPQYSFGPLRSSDITNTIMFWFSAGLMIWVTDLYRSTLADFVQADKARTLLFNELNHRLGNTFAVIQAVVNGMVLDRQLARQIGERIEALHRANKIVSTAALHRISLADIIRDELIVYVSIDRVKLEGPDVSVEGEAARNISLIVHELTTNAAKYGSLSKAGGVLQATWFEKDGFCELEWREANGPPAIKPVKSGFGTRLVTASLTALGGTLSPKFGPEGFSCVLRFPIATTVKEGSALATTRFAEARAG